MEDLLGQQIEKKDAYLEFCYDSIFLTSERRYSQYYLLTDSCLGFLTELEEVQHALKHESHERIIEEFGDVCFFYSILQNELKHLVEHSTKEFYTEKASLSKLECIAYLRKFVAKNDKSCLFMLNNSVRVLFSNNANTTARLLGMSEFELGIEAKQNNMNKIIERYGEQKNGF